MRAQIAFIDCFNPTKTPFVVDAPNRVVDAPNYCCIHIPIIKINCDVNKTKKLQFSSRENSILDAYQPLICKTGQ